MAKDNVERINGVHEYKGYIFVFGINYDDKSIVFWENYEAKDVLNGSVESVPELWDTIEKTVDAYLEQEGENAIPPHEFSGKMMYRTDPETHKGLSALAKKWNVSLNTLINTTIQLEIGIEVTDPKLASLVEKITCDRAL